MQVHMVAFRATYEDFGACEPEPNVSDGTGGAASHVKSVGAEGTGTVERAEPETPANDCGLEVLAAAADCAAAIGTRGRGPQTAACAASLGVAWNCLTD